MRKKMSEQEKRDRKESKRRREIREKLSSQYSIIGFHNVFEYEFDKDHSIRDAEIKAARKRIAELEKLL
jgi:hypothetical protein